MPPRKRKKKSGGGEGSWLVTFADLTTLLLTFFVLLLTMCSMDNSIVTRINLYFNTIGHVTTRGAGKVPRNVELVITLLEDPWSIVEKPNRFKELLFPDDIIPPEIDRSTLLENIAVLQRPEGVALVLSDKLIFRPADARITPPARAILERIAEILLAMDAPVNVAGHTGPLDKDADDQYALSKARAEAVLSYLLEYNMFVPRFSLSCYGQDQPPEALRPTAADPGAMLSKSRVEILVKTTPFFRGY
ncbi:OmpA/MotB family protein [Megalodesulfovibrio gigas]|uniref:Putative OmpA/MotB domain protein n=1 Tax=Megalodesulfovibrio gigas (strain ATCC 19364 / DSM 1382 / NCIMB 9332 / VKM B-1759) TaxID=1121448 RepID=T2G9H6_MEGG1|nr:flagellar motor protein MotB [Megalodesulfovibrio gigas]AGW12776.1 putative OmpA/MotB domain protein [Megalodesulfovibrio gigas DSM 1382 = ATCC 19364]